MTVARIAGNVASYYTSTFSSCGAITKQIVGNSSLYLVYSMKNISTFEFYKYHIPNLLFIRFK